MRVAGGQRISRAPGAALCALRDVRRREGEAGAAAQARGRGGGGAPDEAAVDQQARAPGGDVHAHEREEPGHQGGEFVAHQGDGEVHREGAAGDARAGHLARGGTEDGTVPVRQVDAILLPRDGD